MDALLKELEGKDITEVIASGVSKLASVPAGGGAVAASGGALDTINFMHSKFAMSPRVGEDQGVSWDARRSHFLALVSLLILRDLSKVLPSFTLPAACHGRIE